MTHPDRSSDVRSPWFARLRVSLLAGAVCLGAAGASASFASVADDAPAASAAAASAPNPQDELKTTTEKLRAMIKEHHAEYVADKPKFYALVNEIVVPRFDVPFIGKVVLAANYRTASADQRTRFQNAFKNMLIRSYADALLDNYDSVKVDWQTPRTATDATEALVNAGITKTDGQKVVISFREHLVDGDWKIEDITVEGISLVVNFRTQVKAEIARTSLDDVIQRMERGETIGAPAPGGKK